MDTYMIIMSRKEKLYIWYINYGLVETDLEKEHCVETMWGINKW